MENTEIEFRDNALMAIAKKQKKEKLVLEG